MVVVGLASQCLNTVLPPLFVNCDLSVHSNTVTIVHIKLISIVCRTISCCLLVITLTHL